MSQEKVDKYKQEKANRKKTMAKEKRKKRLYVALGVLIGLAFIAWIVYSVFAEIQQAEDESRAQSEYASWLEEYIQQQATATTSGDATAGTDEATTGEDETTTGEDETTAGEDESTADADKETTGSEEEATTDSEDKE